MAFARARAARTLQSSFRRSIPRVSGRTQLLQRRWASEGGHGHGEPSSDVPWALGAVAITLPSCWYLWPDSSEHGGHHGHDDHHEESHGDEGKEEPAEEEDSPVEEEAKDSTKEQEQKEDSAKPDTEQEQQKEEKKDEEKVESEQKQTSEVKKDDESKPTKEEANDSEGAEVKKVQKDRTIKKSIPSSGQPLGKAPEETGPDGVAKGSGGSMESKQGGVSNTQAKHSIPIGDSPDKSKKPEGGPDTAKATGTVAVKRHD